MDKNDLLQNLKAHDWFYDYSDDGSVWRRGSQDAARLSKELKLLNCPFEWWDIFKAIFNFVIEDFTEVEPGKYYRDPNKTKSIAPVAKCNLLTRVEANKIMEWFNVIQV